MASLGGNNSDAEDTFNIRGGHSEHPKHDILGDLSKPVVRDLVMFDELRLIYAHFILPLQTHPSRHGNPVRPPRPSTLPPPHITGQLVEMGFPPVDARAVVNTMTEKGFDVPTSCHRALVFPSRQGWIHTTIPTST
jgi:hypothetical protein